MLDIERYILSYKSNICYDSRRFLYILARCTGIGAVNSASVLSLSYLLF